jgi:hypothetical protein
MLAIEPVSNTHMLLCTGTCKIDINYMYIKYTFLSGNNLAGLLVFKVLGAVALPVTIPFAVQALDFGLYLGHPRRTSKRLPSL